MSETEILYKRPGKIQCEDKVYALLNKDCNAKKTDKKYIKKTCFLNYLTGAVFWSQQRKREK